jgi:hypothetical protein
MYTSPICTASGWGMPRAYYKQSLNLPCIQATALPCKTFSLLDGSSHTETMAFEDEGIKYFLFLVIRNASGSPSSPLSITQPITFEIRMSWKQFAIVSTIYKIIETLVPYCYLLSRKVNQHSKSM